MRQTVFITILLLYSLSLAHARSFGHDSGSSCFCGVSGGRVCGNDGHTYASQCRADCAGVGVACSGRCPCKESPSECLCNGLHDPVCGTDGQAYYNENCASCKGVGVACRGGCPCSNAACSCITIADPVCGTDGVDYPNECLAGCEGVGVDCKGTCPCQKDCICTKEYAPVCSTAEQTYGNKCEAECDKAEIACEKECPCQTSCSGPLAQCSQDPCIGATCPAHPDAECRANYCGGGCNTDFYLNGNIVDCTQPDGCVCTALADPVCGVDNKMYGNPCNAGCAGVEIACKGECPCQKECNGAEYNCLRDPCVGATCAAHPDAICKPNNCNGCNAEFYKDGALVDCDSECGRENAACDPRLSHNFWSSPDKDKCCPGFECCSCQPIDQGPSDMTVEPKGTCQSECTPCRG